MTILALDLGSRSLGWATESSSGVLRMAALPRGTEHADMRLARTLDRVARWLPDHIMEHNPGLLVVENPFHPALRELMGLVRLIAYRHEVLLTVVQPRTWMAWARKAGITWDKSDEEDARVINLWAQSNVKVEEQ